MWSAIPTNKSAGTEWINTYVEIERLENGRLEYWINVYNSGGSQSTHYKLRYVAFDMGVPPVDAARQSRNDVRKETKAVRSRRTPR